VVVHFEHDHAAIICDFNFKPGNLVLVCNMAIEKSLNRKMHLCYTGPLVVVSRNRGGAYILCELDGTLTHAPFAAFRVLPYFTHEHIDIPDLGQHIDITVACLQEMEASYNPNPEDTIPKVLPQQEHTSVQDAGADSNSE
jgi:hypothetical protein